MARIISAMESANNAAETALKVRLDERSGDGMLQDFHPIAMRLHIVVTPHCCEFGACRAELIDQRLHIARSAGAPHIRMEGRHRISRNTLPVGLRRAYAAVAEHQAQDIALPIRQQL